MACNDDGAGQTPEFYHIQRPYVGPPLHPPPPMWKFYGRFKLSEDMSLSSESGVDNNGYVDAIENRNIWRNHDRRNEGLHYQSEWQISGRCYGWHLRRRPPVKLGVEVQRAHPLRSRDGSATTCYQEKLRRNNICSKGYNLEGQGRISLCALRFSLEYEWLVGCQTDAKLLSISDHYLSYAAMTDI